MENKQKMWAIYYRDTYMIVTDIAKVCDTIGKDAGRIHKVMYLEWDASTDTIKKYIEKQG
jgi:hypothetical protein